MQYDYARDGRVEVIMNEIHEKLKSVRNDFSQIEQAYESATHDQLCADPAVSVARYPLDWCPYKVSIVITAWNCSHSIQYTLRSLSCTGIVQRFPKQVEVVVIDDGSTDDLQQVLSLHSYAYQLIYIRQEHMGRAQAVNLAVYMASGDIIVFCDSDLIVMPYSLDELIKRQQRFLHNAIFFGFRQDVRAEEIDEKYFEAWIDNRIIDFERDNRFLTDFTGGWGTNILLETNMLRNRSCAKNIYVTNNRIGIYDCWQLYRMVYGFLFSVSKENFLRVGGFAEYLVGWGFDDTEFAAKSILNGIKLIPVPSAFVLHINHEIRMKTQWEDGAKNEKLVLEHLQSLEFKNYLYTGLRERILVYKEYPIQRPIAERRTDSLCFRCMQRAAEYHYILGNLEDAFTLMYTQPLVTKDELERYYDLVIRMAHREAYRKARQQYAGSAGFHSALAEFVFEGLLNQNEIKGKYMQFARMLGSAELCKRAVQYRTEQQWYLALRDFFGAYLVCEAEEKIELMQMCRACREQLISALENTL